MYPNGWVLHAKCILTAVRLSIVGRVEGIAKETKKRIASAMCRGIMQISIG